MIRRPSIFFFNDTATTEIYTLSLHDALPISDVHRSLPRAGAAAAGDRAGGGGLQQHRPLGRRGAGHPRVQRARLRLGGGRSEEHTSELQSRQKLVFRLLLVKKKHNPSSACKK